MKVEKSKSLTERRNEERTECANGWNSPINLSINHLIENMFVFGNDVDAAAIADKVSEKLINAISICNTPKVPPVPEVTEGLEDRVLESLIRTLNKSQEAVK
jgi:hypothetical protein